VDGHADAARTRPWARGTIVNVASAAQGPTAICAHRLADPGRQDPAPVATHWPEFAQAGKAAISMHLPLGHRAGSSLLSPIRPRSPAGDHPPVLALGPPVLRSGRDGKPARFKDLWPSSGDYRP
jgi:CubicO group peptidase (beta-lactamase class C family)